MQQGTEKKSAVFAGTLFYMLVCLAAHVSEGRRSQIRPIISRNHVQ